MLSAASSATLQVHFILCNTCLLIITQADAATAQHGFETALVMCGNVVNEDASLGFAHTTSRATEV